MCVSVASSVSSSTDRRSVCQRGQPSNRSQKLARGLNLRPWRELRGHGEFHPVPPPHRRRCRRCCRAGFIVITLHRVASVFEVLYVFRDNGGDYGRGINRATINALFSTRRDGTRNCDFEPETRARKSCRISPFARGPEGFGEKINTGPKQRG